jgi:hypothetical protein
MMARNIRFVQNFIMTLVETKLDDQGQLVATESLLHIAFGETYPVDRWEVNGNSVTIYFPDDPNESRIHGVAHNVELGFCEFTDTVQVAAGIAAASAPGGCGCNK